MARQPAKSAGALLLATLATLLRLTVASSDYFSVSVDTGGDGNRVNLPKFGDRISPRHRYSGEERTSSAAVRANVTHLHRLTANDIIGRKSDEFTNEIDPPIFADSQIESNVSSAQAHRLEMSTEFFVVPPTVATMKPPSIRGVPTSLAGMIVTARTTAEAAGNATPPTIVPTHTIGLRKEGWVVPVLILSIITMITMVGFEVFVLCKVWRTSPSRRHLFLGQMLLLGLFACAGIAAIVTSRPTVVSCAIIRFGSGVAFALVFASLLVKCVFLISINGGVYLPYPYQGLLLLFAVLIQVAVSAQWLLTSPPEVIASPTTRYTVLLASNTSPIQQSVHLCHTPFSEHLLSLIYVVFLILFVAVLAIKSRGIRDNYREATYIGLSIGGCIPIWLGWTLCGLAVAERHRDACLAFGLIATSATVFLVMFMPKGRQLAAMGKEGLYLEDREERCSSLSRTASGYSPSFFHFKPIKYGVMGNNNSGNSTAAAEGGRTGGGSNQNTKHQVIATLGGGGADMNYRMYDYFRAHLTYPLCYYLPIATQIPPQFLPLHQLNHHHSWYPGAGLFMRPDDANVYTTLEQTLSSNPNVYFQRSGGVHPGMMY